MKRRHIFSVTLLAMIAGCGSDRDPAPIDAAPLLGPVSDQIISANEPSTPIAVNVSDESVQTVTLSVTTSNEQLVPSNAIQIGGSGAQRTLTITPVPDVLGDSLVTLTATDAAGQSTALTFALQVIPQQRSLRAFVRDVFAQPATDEPLLINAVEFIDDVADDEFIDLLQ